MTRMWEIREGYDPDERRGYDSHDSESDYYEGFEDGCEHGYKKAMKEMRMMGRRDDMPADYGKDRMNRRYMNPYLPPYPSYRDDDDDDDDMNERRRRRRDARGRYM